MKNVFENWNWNDTWLSFLLIFVMAMTGLVIRAITADHVVRYYYLAGDCGHLEIKGDIDWWEDEVIRLDRAITYEGAVQMVNDLNAGLGIIQYIVPEEIPEEVLEDTSEE